MNRTIALSASLAVACLAPSCASSRDDAGRQDAPLAASPAPRAPRSVTLDADGIRIDGRYTLLRGGSVQWFRIPPEAWEDRLQRFAAGGFNALDLYVPWNVVEPEEGHFQFDRPDLRKFLDLCSKYRIDVVLRPGPFITDEMDGGGLPAWLTRRATKKSVAADGKPNIRTADPDFIGPVSRYFRALNEVVAPYLATRGGPIVLYAIENEYTWFKRFHDIDKLFWYEGGPERPIWQMLDVAAYMRALRDAALQAGMDVPIVTCPGDGTASATGDVPGVVPLPNVYEWGTPKQPEQAAHDHLVDMHDPTKHGGVYVDAPGGSLEIDRSPQQLRRFLVGGFDAVFAFNVVGMIQEGYLNAITNGARALDQPPHWGPPGQPQGQWLSTIFQATSIDDLLSGFVSPQFGYIHDVLDYQGAVSPSGGNRELLYQFRRDNLFFDAVEPLFARAGVSRRSGAFAGADPGLAVDQPEIGTREDDQKPPKRAHYWLDAGDGVAFLGIMNQSGAPQTIAPGAIHFRDRALPRFAPMVVPTADEANPAYLQIVPVNVPVSDRARLAYVTSELLTIRDFDGERLVVVYGPPGTRGELRLEASGGAIALVGAGRSFRVEESTDAGVTLTYDHVLHDAAVLRTADGRRVRVVVTTGDAAGRVWFPRVGGHDLLVAGPDMVTADEAGGTVRFEQGATPRPIWAVAARAFDVSAKATAPYDPVTGIVEVAPPPALTLPPLPDALSRGRAALDLDEARPEYDDAGWTTWDGAARTLEDLGIFRGHAWVRATLDLDAPLAPWDGGRLYVEHASDIVGIYVNGHYVSTVSPVGTEIDNASLNGKYRFASIAPYLHAGRNVIAFRTEIWGHGSFMFPRGKLITTKLQLPSVGYEGQKGLFGEATAVGRPLTHWSARAELGGERRDFAAPTYDDHAWGAASIPLALGAGDVRWYRATFRTGDLPAPERLRAPVALELKGARAKATIFLNGRLIGRWLSDAAWLQHGTYARPLRDMWVHNDPDLYPLPAELLRRDGADNVIAIAFEDASAAADDPGRVDALRLRYDDDALDWNGAGYTHGTIATSHEAFDVAWR